MVAGSNPAPATDETVVGASRASAQAPDQRFRDLAWVEDRGFSGLFIGTYSAVPCAVLCRVARRVRPLRSGFAVECSVDVAVHRVA